MLVFNRPVSEGDARLLELMFDRWQTEGMSGGMGRPWTTADLSSSGTLAERSGAGRDERAAADRDERSGAGRHERAALSHHCWVRDSPGSTQRHPGLVLEWRRDARRWFGLVVYVQREDTDRVRLTQRWVASELLEPVDRS